MKQEPSELQQLRQLLIAPEASALADLERNLDLLQHQIHDPEKLSGLLAPIIADVIRRGDPALSMAIVKAITPLLDHALRGKVTEDVRAIAGALAPASTGAIAMHYASEPQEAAQDLAPLMSAAIKEQIRGERDAMIDALYPVIGSTISKYLSETLTTLVRTINERIESHFSFHSLALKVRSRVTGVSEAELLLRESLPLRIEAAFLIHKSSGLVIAQAQNPNAVSLDPDLISGMLTAIRSLFNDSMNTAVSARELDQIEYGESKIVIEAAGYCYLAAVVRGIPDEPFHKLLRTTLATIVQQYGSAVEQFSGRSEAVPPGVRQSVREFVDGPKPGSSARHRRPYGAMAAGLLLLLLICVPVFLNVYRNNLDRNTEKRISSALISAHPSALRNILVKVDRDNVYLSGIAPNEYLRQRAGEIAAEVSPGITLENGVAVNGGSPFPILLQLRTEEIVAALNTVNGVYLESRLQNGELIITGVAADSSLHGQINRTFEELPGLRAFSDHVKTGEMEIARRLLFNIGAVTIRPGDREVPAVVKGVLDRTPWSKLLIVGHSDELGGEGVNRRIAAGRAAAAQTALRGLGVPSDRIVLEGRPGPPSGIISNGADSLSRCVRFILLSRESGAHE